MLDVGDEDAVALAGLAGLRVEVELGHEEQRQTLGAGTGALGARQHQVHDVLEQVIGVGRGDEALHAVDVPGAVGLLDGLGATGAHVRAGVRLGEDHGRAPAAVGGELGPLLLLLGAEVVEDVGESGTHRVHVDGGVRAQDVLLQGPRQRARHRGAAELLVDAQFVPAALDDRAHRLLERLGQRHGVRLGIEDGRVAVALFEGLGHGTLGETGHFSQHLGRGLGVEIGVGTRAEHRVDAVYLEQVEYLVANIALVVAHGNSSSSRTPRAVGYSGQVTHQ